MVLSDYHFYQSVSRDLFDLLYVGRSAYLRLPDLSRSCTYLDELLTASDSLWKHQEDTVTMSADLREAALHMNEVRLNLIESQKAAEAAEQRKNDLVVYLAHDLKTPLTSVIGYLTLLHDEKEISPALQEKYLGVALEKAERLEDLINEFFDITRFNLTHLTLDVSPDQSDTDVGTDIIRVRPDVCGETVGYIRPGSCGSLFSLRSRQASACPR